MKHVFMASAAFLAALASPANSNAQAQSARVPGPSAFGTLAMPFDYRGAPLPDGMVPALRSPVSGSALRYLGGCPANRLSLLRHVQERVNTRVEFRYDAQMFDGAMNRWKTANDALIDGEGDSEDIAVAKLQALRRCGFPAGDLYVSFPQMRIPGDDGAVLLVRFDGRYYVLGPDGGVSESQGGFVPRNSYSLSGTAIIIWGHVPNGQRAETR